LKRPTPAALLRDYPAARAWAAELTAAVGPFAVETAEVGRTTIGSTHLPAAAVFVSADGEIAFAGKSREAARFTELADGLTGLDPGADDTHGFQILDQLRTVHPRVQGGTP
jgi:hypothetical protein